MQRLILQSLTLLARQNEKTVEFWCHPSYTALHRSHIAIFWSIYRHESPTLSPRFGYIRHLRRYASPSAQLSPDKAIKSFKTSPGLEISLWASEVNPLDPAAKEPSVNLTKCGHDHNGGRFVNRSTIEPACKQKINRLSAGDRILILRTPKGRGHADKAHGLLSIARYPRRSGSPYCRIRTASAAPSMSVNRPTFGSLRTRRR